MKEQCLYNLCYLGSYPALALPTPSTDTCVTISGFYLTSASNLHLKKRYTFRFQVTFNWKNKVLTEFRSKTLVNLLYATIYTVCIYSINISEAFTPPQKPSIHLYSCKKLQYTFALYKMSNLSGMLACSDVPLHFKASNRGRVFKSLAFNSRVQ